MNDINEMPPKCQYCPYWEVCEYPWVCPDREQLATNLKPTCNQLATDTISRQAAIDALRKMQTYKLFSGDDMLLIDQAGAQTELMMLSPAQPDVPDINVGDMISRQAAIDYFVTNVGFHDEDGYPIEDSDELRKIWTEYFDGIPSAQPETHDKRTETHACDCISRKDAIDDAHAMPDFEKVEKVIIDNLYVGDKKVTDLIASGRLRLVGFCKECKHCFPPLVCKVDGEVVQVTSDRCSIWNGYVEKNGWCYKFEMRTDMRGEQDE